MLSSFMSWFPSRAYANLYATIVLLTLLSDQIIPVVMGGKRLSFGTGRDRGSFVLIYAASLIGLGIGLYLRLLNIGIVPFWVQLLALGLLMAATVLREWSIVVLGRFFSRLVVIEEGQRLITSGPYRWVRHPSYTGMLLMDASIILGLGTWVGAILMFALLLLAALYRIRVEERALLDAFGDEYRAYMHRTPRLFPAW